MKGIIFNIEKYAIHDGPGIRTTVFFKGCPLDCWWCHNPEGKSQSCELVCRQGRCIGCSECVKGCPRKALSFVSKQVVIDRELCRVCGKCAEKCPSEALSIVGKKMSANDVMDIIERDEPFYNESGGGVTFSGGEPLLQPDFLEALVRKCMKKDIDTTLDTSGYGSTDVVNRLCCKVDLFLYDVKIMDDSKHVKYTGVSNKLILRNAQAIAKKRGRLAVSLPIIPSINDDEENIRETGEFVASLRNVEYVSLLPYHKMGIDKYRNLGKPYRLDEVQTPSSQKVNVIKEKFETFGIEVKVEER